MRGIIIGLIVLSFVLPSMVINADESKTFTINVSKPNFIDKGEYVLIDIKEADSWLMEKGKPIIPTITKTFTFPAGTEIIDIIVNIEKEKYVLSKKIAPSPEPIPLSSNKIPQILPDEKVYDSDALYPSQSYKIREGMGIENGEHVLFLNIKCYAQYSPAKNIIYIPDRIDIKIKYRLPSHPLFTADEYDLLIITDEKFKDKLQRLVEHKNNIGIRTILKTTQEIYSQYNGRDSAEDIKLFIKDAIEKWGIKYVLLFGGRKGQTLDWYIPERRSNNEAERPGSDAYESGYATDLYYADIYKANGGFEDWDSNGNGIFAEFSYWGAARDIIDYYPDVYVGRIPVRYSWEADIVINKIIDYESKGNPSFRRAFFISGDTFPPTRGPGIAKTGIYEGEIVADLAASYLEDAGFNIEKLYTSKGTFTSYQDVVNSFNAGAGFIYFGGHGNPAVWGNFLPDAKSEEEFVLGFTIFDIWKYANYDELPVVVIGGCHNAQFNITMQHFVEGNKKAIMYGEAYPTDGASWMLLKEGGSIASIGNTGYGYGYINTYCTMGLGGWIEPRFFHAYAVQGKKHLGEAHGQAITDYINIIGNVNEDHIDRKTIEEWALLGDPSLKLGGGGILTTEYPRTEYNYCNDDVPVWEVGMKWMYKVSNFDFTLDEVEGRYVDLHLKIGELNIEVVEAGSEHYKLEFNIPDADVNIDVFLDFIGPEIKGHLMNISVEGNIEVNKNDLGIKKIDALIEGKVDLESLPINISLPPFIKLLLKFIPIIIKINLQIDLDKPYPIISFPLSTGKTWGLPPVNVTIDGTIESGWFRLLKIINGIARIFGMQFIPPDIAKLLPVISIPELLSLLNISNEIKIPKIWDPLYIDIHMFKCSSKEKIKVEAGEFEAYDIQMVRGIGQIYYSADAENIIMARGNFNEIIPIMEDFVIELTSFEK